MSAYRVKQANTQWCMTVPECESIIIHTLQKGEGFAHIHRTVDHSGLL